MAISPSEATVVNFNVIEVTFRIMFLIAETAQLLSITTGCIRQLNGVLSLLSEPVLLLFVLLTFNYTRNYLVKSKIIEPFFV